MNKIDVAIAGFVKNRIMVLFRSKEALAKLRRGIGKELGDIPELLGFVLPSSEITPYKENEIKVDKAVYTVLTLYALHQQGNDNKCMNDDTVDKENISKYNYTFGHAIRKLVNNDKNKETAITRRFDKVLTAKDITELAVHARGLIGLLKKADIPMGYSGFAVDLYWFQYSDYRRNVIVRWGRDYYMSSGKDD